MGKFAYTVLALTLALIALPGGATAATTTLDNLQAGFNGESNAHSRYLAFAEKADQEGYGEVASLFRAAAKAEEVHATNHAAVIKKMGGTPEQRSRLRSSSRPRKTLRRRSRESPTSATP